MKSPVRDTKDPALASLPGLHVPYSGAGMDRTLKRSIASRYWKQGLVAFCLQHEKDLVETDYLVVRLKRLTDRRRGQT